MSHDDDFHVLTFAYPGHAVVALAGDVDASIYTSFRAAAHAAVDATDHVTFDCAGVTFMDASGLSVIAETLNRVSPRGGAVLIHRASRPVLRLLEVTGFDSFVSVSDEPTHGDGMHRICRHRPRPVTQGFPVRHLPHTRW